MIHPTDNPSPSSRSGHRPNPARPTPRPADPPAAVDPSVYIYRDDSEPAPPSRTRPEDDSAYWYDLGAEDSTPQHEDSRGPFEPLVSSTEAETPGAETLSALTPSPEIASRETPGLAHDGGAGAQEHGRARTLDQLRDLYLTAEAIGEQNVDRHFNELLAQQRQLIYDYFSQGDPAPDGPAEPQQAARAAETPPPAGDVTPPEGVTVRAVPPRTW